MSNLKPGPLTGVTVLDFTWVLAGPHAAKTLADMGANVIKVEQYKAGANERWLPKRVEKNGVTQSSYTINVNRGKRSICVNMKSPKGMEIIKKLIKKSDVLIENFAPDVMGKLKLDYDKVKEIKPDIIYCSISSFGHWGPYWDRPGYDMIAQGASGWSNQSKPPIIAPMSIGDTVAAIHATTAINAALYHRKVTGQGQNIDISMMDCLFSLHENTLPWYLISTAAGQTGKELDIPKIGGQHPGYAPYGLYEGKDGIMAIACLTEPRWQPLVKLMGKEFEFLLTDPRAKDVSTRCSVDNAPYIHEQLSKWVMSLPSVAECEKMLDEAGVPCIRCRTLKELADSDPQIKAREMMVEMYQPFLGPMRHYGSPLKFSETPAGPRGYAPFVGEHNVEVLTKELGMAEADVKALYGEDVLYHAPEVDRLPDELKKNSK
jgi:crotonobetainyl-CoA:carnitine CoA-transferase CaiB-like acyl-CoA transferase